MANSTHCTTIKHYIYDFDSKPVRTIIAQESPRYLIQFLLKHPHTNRSTYHIAKAFYKNATNEIVKKSVGLALTYAETLDPDIKNKAIDHLNQFFPSFCKTEFHP